MTIKLIKKYNHC